MPRSINQAPRAFSCSELAAAWGCTERSIRNWINEGRIPTFRVGSRIMIPLSAVEAIESSTWSPRGSR
jgi:excisionase family DNA binding protein